MRPLYAVAVIGPICLLDGEHISSHSRSGWTLTQITQCSVLGVTDTCMERVCIEADLLNLLIDAATQGSHIIEERLEGLVPRWKESLGIIPPSPSISTSVNEKSVASSSRKMLLIKPRTEKQTVVRDAIRKTLRRPVDPRSFTETIAIEINNTEGRGGCSFVILLF